RWGRHWLDQARYADSDGFSIDGDRTMWPYRDWVIGAINDDMPFNQFTIEQLAGDLLETPSIDQLVATGFHRNTLVNQEGGSDPEQFRNEAVVDRVNTTGAVWLGLTLGCAQCHSHKFDPISQREYYQLFAFFNSDTDVNSHTPDMVAAPSDQQAELADLKSKLADADARLKAHKQQHPDDKDAEKSLSDERREAESQVRRFESQFGKTLVMKSLDEPRVSHVHIRGDFLRHGEVVKPNVPTSLGALQPSARATRNRLDLAQWLVSDLQPLTPRVTVNRLWMHYFGRGLVETENDFGTQGTPPTHPELLDWLASELVRSEWSLKRIHRLIVMSATYRQSSHTRPDIDDIDAPNRLLARQNRLRVSSEIIRDLVLCSSGLLTDDIGGRSVYPPQPDGVYAFTQNKKNWRTSKGGDRYRRGMYTFFYRSAPHPFLTTFDTPNFQTTCTRRLRSNTPLQSLTMANDQMVLEAARTFALRLLAANTASDTERLDLAYASSMLRRCRAEERATLLNYLQQQRESFASDESAAIELLEMRDDDTATAAELVERAAWTSLCRVILNLDEFVTRN
ncbi:MAG: DUF1553 domain-containing protein, partial [Planctomycetales bacterium]|nr:DUF1553 domain-containing protein [Planctomycetales bacterium]